MVKRFPAMPCFFFFAVLAMMLYGHALEAPLYLDDRLSIDVSSGLDLSSFAVSSLPRPGNYLSNFSRFLSYQASEIFRLVLPLRRGFYFRVLTVIFHAITATLLFGLVHEWTREWFASAAAGAVFLVHPIQTSAVTYIAERTEVQATMFMVACAYSYVRFQRDGYRWLFQAVAFAVAAIWSKQNAVIIVPWLGLIAFFMGARPNVRHILYSLPILLILFSVALDVVFRNAYSMFYISWLEWMRSQGAVITQYLQLIVFPHEQFLYYDFPVVQHFSWTAAAQWGLVSLVLAASVFLLRKGSLSGLGMASFFLLLSPVILVPRPNLIFEYRLYPALVGVAIALASFFRSPRTVTIVLLALIVGILGYRTIKRNAEWTDDIRFLELNRARFPEDPFILVTLGAAYYEHGQVNKALDATNEARRYEDRANAYYRNYIKTEIAHNLSSLYAAKQKLEAAHLEALRAVAFSPDSPKLLERLGEIKIALGDSRGAEAAFRAALKQNPSDIEAWEGLAALLSNLGDTDGAELATRRAKILEEKQERSIPQRFTIPAKYERQVGFALACSILVMISAGIVSFWHIVSKARIQSAVQDEHT